MYLYPERVEANARAFNMNAPGCKAQSDACRDDASAPFPRAFENAE